MAVPNAFDERSIPNLPGVERGDIDLNKTEPKTAVKTGRVQWIDFAKGIAILATILGHTADVGKTGSDVRALIFSFHMPLFFILSILTYRCSNSLEEYKMKQKKAAKHLLVPAVVVFAIATVIECVQDTTLLTQFEYWQEKLYTFIIGSGTSVEYSGISVAAFGIAWFFFALFIGRAIFDYIHLSMKEDFQILVVSMIVGAIGMIWGMLMQLPFSLDIALAIMPFFYWGYRMKRMDLTKSPLKKALIWGVIWIVTLMITVPDWEIRIYLELANRRYPLFPICFVTAVAGTMCISELSVIFCKAKHLVKPIVFLGRNSLYLLCVHILDGNWESVWHVEGHQFHTALRRCVADIIVFLAVMLVLTAWKKIRRSIQTKKAQSCA